MRAGIALILILLGWAGWSWAGGEDPVGTVTGRIPCSEAEACRGVAALWRAGEPPPPDPRLYIVIPTVNAPLESDGSFSLSAPPGRYYLGAVRRQGRGFPMGPPRPGDRIFMTPDARGNFRVVEIAADQTIDVGLQEEGWTYEGFEGEPRTGITGKVQDAGGRPASGLLVFAFTDPDMSGSPLAVSDRTDAEGRFVLRLPRSGEVYLRVMENYGGGRPAGGGRMGVYGGRVPQRVVVSEEKVVRDLSIEVIEVPPLGAGKQRRMAPGRF